MMFLRVPAHPDDHPDVVPHAPGAVVQRRIPGLAGRQTIRIHVARYQPLADVTVKDARAEGYRSRDPLAEFKADWIGRHDKRWLNQHPGATASELAKRWAHRHAHTGSWVLSFVILEDTLCLRRQAGDNPLLQRTDGQYVGAASMSIDPECEAVDRAFVDRLAADAQLVQATAKAAAVAKRRERKVERYVAHRARV